MQVIIMVTPINKFFRVSTQNWQEWLFAIALGAGSLLVAILTKLLSRHVILPLLLLYTKLHFQRCSALLLTLLTCCIALFVTESLRSFCHMWDERMLMSPYLARASPCSWWPHNSPY
jgi:hypothetical protein